MKIELKQVVYPYCREEDQSTLQTVVSTCKRKRIPQESAGLRELPFLPKDCLSVREVYSDKGKSQAATSAKNGVSCVWSRRATQILIMQVKSKLVPPHPGEATVGPCRSYRATNGHDLHSVADKQAGTGAGRVRVCYSSVCS